MEEHPEHHHLHVPTVADRRGLTAVGAVTIGLSLALLGGIIDVNTGRGLRTVFAICFIAGSAIAALLSHREDLKATVIMPPLIYLFVALVGAAFGHAGSGGPKQDGLELVSSLISTAPVLYAATGLAFVIALVRVMTSRQP